MKEEYDFSDSTVTPGLDPKSTKIQTSIRLDADLFMWLQSHARQENIPYQTMINKLLRESMQRPSVEDRLTRIEKKVFPKHG